MHILFVANVNFKVTESAVECLLQQSGVKYLRVRMPAAAPEYADCNNRGYCFVSFETREDYAAAETFLSGRELAGKLLRTSQAKPKVFKHNPYENIETRRTSTISLQPTYRDFPPSHSDMREKGAL